LYDTLHAHLTESSTVFTFHVSDSYILTELKILTLGWHLF